ncbi:MAG TPA: hypothetical protein VMT88_09340 [Actinomycetes bacterium]|nr:hypothetical protein [Actinomycetes bacterium]
MTWSPIRADGLDTPSASSRTISTTVICLSVLLPLSMTLPESGMLSPVRVLCMLVFFFAVPGLALVRAFRLDGLGWTPGLAIVSSIAMGVIVTTAWAYFGTGNWLPPVVALALCSVALGLWRLAADVREVTP